MVKIALGVEYDGNNFCGWQTQPNLRTAQTTLEQAVSQVANQEIKVFCAGRTDTGVHASGQVVHFETDNPRNMRAWTFGVNSNLPNDICVRWYKVVEEDFHARFSALARHYRYLIFNNPNRPALFARNLTWQYRPLDAELMDESAKLLVGEHDFTSFRSVNCQSNTATRILKRCDVRRYGDLIVIDVEANAFLHNMVRNIAGVLMSVGAGKQDVSWTSELLDAKDRSLGADTAPPYGLYLINVKYPEAWQVPESDTGPLFLKELGFA